MPDDENQNDKKNSTTSADIRTALMTATARILLILPWDTRLKQKQSNCPPPSLAGLTITQRIAFTYRGAIPTALNSLVRFGALTQIEPYKKEIDKEISHPMLANFATGISLSFLQVPFHPLSTIKTGFQLRIYNRQKIFTKLSTDSWSSLYKSLKEEKLMRGAGTSFSRSILFISITSGATDYYKKKLQDYRIGGDPDKKETKSFQKSASTFFATTTALMMLLPIDWLKTNLQAKKLTLNNIWDYRNIWDFVKFNFKKTGTTTFFKGTVDALIPEFFMLAFFSYLHGKNIDDGQEKQPPLKFFIQPAASSEEQPPASSLPKRRMG